MLTVAGCIGPPGVGSGRILAWTSNGSIFLQRGEEGIDTLGRGFYPALSPDGSRVACIRDIPGTQSSEIVLFDLETGAESSILESPDMLMDLSWSPDGRALAFVAGSLDGSRALQVCPPDGSSSMTLYSASGRQGPVILRPSWLPGSQGLVYNDESSLYKVFLDGTSHEWIPLETMTHDSSASGCADRFVVCPADTTLIAYTRLIPATVRLTVETSVAATHALFIFDSDARSSLQLTTSNMCALDPVWASDGSTIFFSGFNSTMADQGVQAVYSLDLASGRYDVVAFGQSPDAN
jgi:Tol biopolymer transport system component